ncbi:hypothetical protein MRX96_033068 [Rhipicephalus microplus]
MSLKCQIEWAAGCRRQQFLCVPDLCRDVVLGRDFLTVSGISLHVSLGGWTVGTEPQRISPFVKAVKVQPEAVDDFGDSLRCVFAESDATVCASVPEATAACNVIISGHSSDLDPRMKHILEELSEIFTTTPGCTTLAEHRIDTGDNPPVRCKLRPVNSKKQAIMDNCIQDLLAQNLIRPSQSQHASAPVLVEKKSGGYRMAVDYRQLNARTKVPVYPMPRTDWLLAQLGRARSDRLLGYQPKGEKEMRKDERGSTDMKVVEAGDVALVRWKDKNLVTVASTQVFCGETKAVSRWCSSKKERIEVKCPQAILEYNRHMGGVDKIDSIMSLYHIRATTKNMAGKTHFTPHFFCTCERMTRVSRRCFC